MVGGFLWERDQVRNEKTLLVVIGKQGFLIGDGPFGSHSPAYGGDFLSPVWHGPVS